MNKSAYFAGMMVCLALLVNDLILFNNLNLNSLSIFMLFFVGAICFWKYLSIIKNEPTVGN